MVAIVSGNSLGLSLTSLEVLGQRGPMGNAAHGRSGEAVYVNVSNGNLVLQGQDEWLVGRGEDVQALRIYNSQGLMTDDNGDNWSLGTYSQQMKLTGTVMTAGSTLTRTGRDGSQAVFTFDASLQVYTSVAGAGGTDAIFYDASNSRFVHKDAETLVSEHYEGSGLGRLLKVVDTAGNTSTYSYNANSTLASIATANGETTYFDYVGTNLAKLRVVTASGTETRTSYSYDANNRLSTVTVDLSPDDNSISDGHKYVTTYTYDGTSKRVASVSQADGSRTYFTYVSVGGQHRVAAVTDAQGRVTSYTYNTTNHRTTVTDPLGFKTVYAYDLSGQLTQITGPVMGGVSQVQNFTYNASGDVIGVTDAEGRQTTIQYDWLGRPVLQRDAVGNTITLTYSDRNKILTQTVYLAPDPDGSGSGQPASPLTSRFAYQSDWPGLLRFELSPEGRVTEHRYNSYGERIATIQYNGAFYNLSSLTESQAPDEYTLTSWAAGQNKALTHRTDMVYDTRGQLQSVTAFSKVASSGAGVADGTQSVTQYVYGRSGELLQTVSANSGATNFTYDGLGRQLSAQNALGQITLSSYDDANRKTAVTLANGLVTTSTYDSAGRLISVMQTDGASANFGTTQYFHDANGRLRMTQDATGVRNWVLYDEAGRKIADIDSDGSVTEYLYNKNNQVTRTIAYATVVSTASLVDGGGLPTNVKLAAIRPSASGHDKSHWFAYDSANRLVKTVDAMGTVTMTVYDGASRAVSTVRYASPIATAGLGNAPTASSIAPATSGTDRTQRSIYDKDGLLLATLDAEGYLTEFIYDRTGRLTRSTAYATATATQHRASGTLTQLRPSSNAADATTHFLLNGKGQIVGQIDPEGYLIENVYDANGNLTQSIRYASRVTPSAIAALTAASTVANVRPAANPADRAMTRTYDLLNRATQEINAESTATQFTYDTVGRLVATTRAASTADVRALLVRYDQLSRLTGELSAEGAALLTGGQTQTQIDAIWAQHGIAHTYDAAGRRMSTTDALGNRTLFFYDTDNRLTHSVNALGEVTENQYNALGQLVATVRYGTRISTVGLTGGNAGGLVNAALSAAIDAIRNASLDSKVVYTYNQAGRANTVTDAGGYATTLSYNAFGEETSRSQAIDGSQQLVQTRAYDKRGLQTSAVTDPSGINAITSAVYDAFGRLTRSTDARGNVQKQSYDRLGRVVTETNALAAVRSTTYDAFDRILTHTDALGKVTTYSHSDSARSVTVTTPEAVTVTTVHNRHGQTQSVTDGRGNTTSHAYDKGGNLLTSTTALTTTSAQYDHAGRLSQTVDANGNVVVLTYDAANRLLTRTVDPTGLNQVTTYAYDAKGQQIGVTDPNGILTQLTYNLKGQLSQQSVDPAGLNLTTQYTYDGRGNTLVVTRPEGTQTHYIYDKFGRRIQERIDPLGLNLTKSYAYDANGNVTTATNPNGGITRYVYDADNRLVYSLDPLGNLKLNGYDAEGRVVKTVAYATPVLTTGLPAAPTVAQIQALVVTDAARDLVEHRVLGSDGRLLASVNALGEVVKYTYDANGNVIESVGYANRVAMPGWTVGTMPAPTANAVSDVRIRTVYDQLNRALYTIDGVGAVVAQTYDGNGNVIERTAYAAAVPGSTDATTAALAAAVVLVANAARDQKVRSVYDSANRLAWSANGAGAVTRWMYDGNGNVTKTVQYATRIGAGAEPSSVVVSSADRLTAFVYDSANRNAFVIDSLGHLTQIDHDRNGNVKRRIAYQNPVTAPTESSAHTLAGTQAAAVVARSVTGDRLTFNFYDAADRQVLDVDALGGVREFAYDATGNLVQDTRYATRIATAGLSAVSTTTQVRSAITVNATEDRIQRHVYDATGRQVYAVDGAGHVTQSTYDGVGHLTSRTAYKLSIPGSTANTLAATSAAVVATPAEDHVDTFAYNASGRLIQSTDAHSKSETYVYDGLGRKISFTNKAGAVWSYEYDSDGRMTKETSPQVELTAMTVVNPGDSLVPTTVTGSIVTVLAYDALGNLTARTEGNGRPDPEQRTTHYEYDAVGRQVRTIFSAFGVYDAATDALTSNGATSAATRVEDTYPLYSQVTYNAFGDAIANRDVAGAMSYKAYDKLGQLRYDVDALGFVTQYGRNAWGQVATTTRFSASTNLVDGAPNFLTTAQIQAAVYPSGGDHSSDRTLITEYDQLGQKVAVREPSTYVYDSTSNTYGTAEKTTRFVYNAFGELRQEAVLNSANALTYSYTTHYYDKRGLEVATVDALGHLTTQYHDSWGNLDSRKEHATAVPGWNGASPPAAPPTASASLDDRATKFIYDRLNRKVLESRLNVEFTTNAKSTVVTRGSINTAYTYDVVGNTTSVTDAKGEVTYTFHDALGRVKAIVFPGRTVDGVFKMPLTTFRRDAHGNVLVKTDHANGASAATTAGFTSGAVSLDDRDELARYDSHGHVVQTTDAAGSNRYTSYNSRGEVAKEWQAVTDANDVTKTIFKAYKYDALGNQTHIITPATTEVFAGGVSLSSGSSSLIALSTDENGAPTSYGVTGTNTIALSWPNLVESGGGLVRVQVSYNTLSTLIHVGTGEYGAPIYIGAASQSKSRTQDYTATSAFSGINMSWYDSAATVGGISSISYIRVWQQNAAGTWIMKWDGTGSQATGSGVVTVTQAQAGVDETQMEFNAFGEMTRRGINGGRQEYFTYDNSGFMWRTNADDGVDKVMLHDVQGRQTAQIVSGGTSNLLNFSTSEQVAALTSSDVQRTNTLYDFMGRVTSQQGPERVESQGGVTVRRNYVNAPASSGSWVAATDEYGVYTGGYWTGTNSINLSWSTLEGLGSGEVKVVVDYTTKNYDRIAYTAYDEYGTPFTAYTHGYTAGAATSRTQILTAEQAKSGITMSWIDSAHVDTGHNGGVQGVSRVRVWKKNESGNWVAVIDKSAFGYSGNTIEVAAPKDSSTTVQLQMRLQGATTWINQPLLKFDDAHRFDASALAAGNWEYQVLTTNAGDATRVTSSGVMNLAGGVLGITSSTDGGTRNVRPVINQTLDRWGNVIETNDARSLNWKTTFRYNANNQVVEQKRPDATGGLSANSPVTSIYYDQLGRQVTSVDANGNVSGQVFDSVGQLQQEQHADGGLVTYTYSLFGDKVRKVDARNYTTTYSYDKLSRLLQTTYASVDRYTVNASNSIVNLGAGSIVESNTWDQAGRKKTQTNGAGETLKYFYDLQGNLLKTTFPLTQSAKSIYNARGYKTVEVDANGNTNLWSYDYFGQVTGHSDLANNRYTYTYNAARQLIGQTNTLGANKSYAYDRAGQLIQINDIAYNQVTNYAYDLSGNRVQESTTRGGVVYQDNHLAYDTLGRLRWVADSRAMVNMEYDKAGNRTRIQTHVINGDTSFDSDRYFKYDAMNRQTTVDAVDAAGNIGTKGRTVTYDLNGNRTGETFHGTKVSATNGALPNGTVNEVYSYDAMSRLKGVSRDGTAIDSRLYDTANRVVQSGGNQSVAYYNALYGAGVVGTGSELRINRYDANGRTAHVRVMTSAAGAKYNLNYSNYDAAGNLLGYTLTNYQGTAYTNTYTYGLLRRDAYKEATVSGTSSYFAPATTTNSYDANNNLYAVSESGNGANNRSFVTDDAGRVLYKSQNGAVERQLVANGEVLGRFGGALAEFNFGYTPISAAYPKATPGTFAVGASDSLRSIAKAVYGDSSLWYLIAEANGLESDKELRVGQTLNVPNRVTGAANNAGTFKPYDPSVVVGDTTPTLPNPPPPDKGCGVLGQIIMIVVAVVATIYTAGALAGASGSAMFSTGVGVLGGSVTTGGVIGSIGVMGTAAVAGAVGSIASQVAGNMLGVQDGFSWKSVALGAISGGVTAGVGQAFGAAGQAAGQTTVSWQQLAVRAAVGNAITQGVGVITGLQEKFDWRGVAASAVGAGVGHGLNLAMDYNPVTNFDFSKSFASSLSAGTAAAVMRGGKVAVQQVAIDAFGNALGQSLAAGSGQVAGSSSTTGVDRLGAFIEQNQGAWHQRQANYDQMVDAFSNPTIYGPENDVSLAAGPGYSGMGSSSQRDANIARMLRLANQPEAMGSEVPFRVEVNGVGWTGANVLPDGTQVYRSTDPANDLQMIEVANGEGSIPILDGYGFSGVRTYAGGADLLYSPGVPQEAANVYSSDSVSTNNPYGFNWNWIAGAGLGVGVPSLRQATPVPINPILPVNNGRWTGVPGNSGWVSTNASVNAVTGGRPVQFKNDMVNFDPWSQGRLNVPNMTGANSDLRLGRDALRERYGFPTDEAAKQWLRERKLTLHHNANGLSLDLIPSDLHNTKNGGIPHTGGASVLRGWDAQGTPLEFYNANRIATGARYLGGAAMAYGAYADGKSLYGQYQISHQTGSYANTIAEGTRIAGGWAGAWAVGGAGAQFGAGFGSAFGPVGTVVGGILGGAVGGVLGYAGGSYALPRVVYDFKSF